MRERGWGEGAADRASTDTASNRSVTRYRPQPPNTESPTPMTYKSTFQDRAAQAAEAKQKALEQYRARPPVDEAQAAERVAAGEARSAARAEKAATKKADRKAAGEAAAAKAAASAPKSEAELKAARDARYAKRKARK